MIQPFAKCFIVVFIDNNSSVVCFAFKVALSGLRRFRATESPLKMMKNAFYSNLKTLFIQFLFWIFGHVGKRLDKKAKINAKIYDITNR